MKKRFDIDVNLNGAKGATTQMQTLGNTIKSGVTHLTSMSSLVKGAFASALVMGTANLVKTAAAAQGVEMAFNRLNKPGLLTNLQTATRDMVSDFDLMKAAVRANNFQIPLEQLGTLLEFAQRRAEETGESVDYLTESIVMGIGRKSVMILDNLGLSAIRVREEFKKTGDMAKAVAKIASEEMSKMGTSGESMVKTIGSLTASWENFKIGLGDFIYESPILNIKNDLDGLTMALNTGAKGWFYYLTMQDEALKSLNTYKKLMDDFTRTKEGAKFTPDMLFSQAGKNAEESRRKMAEAEAKYIEWVMTLEDELAKTQLLAEYRQRYNKEVAQSLNLYNTNPQAKANRLTLYYQYSQPAEPDVISQDNLIRSQKRVDALDKKLKELSDEYQRNMDMISREMSYYLSSSINLALDKGRVAVKDFVDYFKRQLLEQALYAVINAIIKYYTSGGSDTVSTVSNLITGETPVSAGAGGTVGGGNTYINISGNVMSKAFVNDEVIPQIRNAVRLGRA